MADGTIAAEWAQKQKQRKKQGQRQRKKQRQRQRQGQRRGQGRAETQRQAREVGVAGERILVVEDDRAVARGLTYALSSEGYDVRAAASGEDALVKAREEDPQLLLLDVRLPGMSGFDVLRTLRGEGRRMPILMLTARDEEMDKVLGLELGADDYVVKPYALRELLSRVRALLRRAYGDLAEKGEAETLSFGEIEIDADRMRVLRAGEPVDLTPIEFRLLRHLALNPDRPMTRDALIEAVWGYEAGIGSDRTVDVHVRHLRQKIEEDPAHPRWIVTVRGVGYKLDGSGQGS